MPEIWDIYDKNKQRTGRTMIRDDWNMTPEEYHLTVLGLVRRADGKYLITQRKLDKPWGAGWWELPGGGVQAGEDGDVSARREVTEETGVDVTGATAELIFTYERTNYEAKNNYFVDIYRFDMDIDEKDVHVQEEEVESFMFATKEEIDKLGNEGIFLHYDSIKSIF